MFFLLMHKIISSHIYISNTSSNLLLLDILLDACYISKNTYACMHNNMFIRHTRARAYTCCSHARVSTRINTQTYQATSPSNSLWGIDVFKVLLGQMLNSLQLRQKRGRGWVEGVS